MIITALIMLFILLFVLLAVLTFARDVLVTIIAAIVGLFRKRIDRHHDDRIFI